MHQKRPAQKLKCLSRIYYTWNAFAAVCRLRCQQGRFFIQWNSLTLKKSLSVDACLGCRDHKRCAEHCWWVALCKNKTIKSLRGNLPTKCRVVRLPTKFAKRFNQANLHSPIVFRLKWKFHWRKRKSAKFAAILFIYVYIKAVCIPTPFVNAIVRFCICLWQI